jgi:phospholipid/cholesterol/gamma-HCH transport system substrate-binding protein
MESKANHLLVGVFVLGVIGLLLGFLYWMQNASIGTQGKSYHVVFDGSVQGLTEAAPVLFNGIRFGSVKTITILPEDTRKVRALVTVRGDTPVRVNSRARISQQGLAGWTALEITPGTPDAALLEPVPGEPLPVLLADATASSGSMFAGVPDAVGNANALLARLNNLVANNEDSVRATLTNIEGFTAMMNERKDDIAAIIQDARGLSARFGELSKKLEAAVDNLAGAAGDNPNSAVAQVQQAATSFRQLAEKLDRSLGDQSEGLTKQAQRGLREFELFMRDGRRLAESLDRVVQKVERNPAGFLLGGQQTPQYSGTGQ